VLGGVAINAGLLLHAQVPILVDIKTVGLFVSSVNDSPVAPRLYLDDAFTQPAPLGTTIWFVADLDGDGVATEASADGRISPDRLLASDDYFLFADVLDGDQPGPVAGQYRRVGLAIDPPEGLTTEQLASAHISVLLWNFTGTDTAPQAGSTFGVLDLGVIPAPPIGNPFWAIDENLSASTYLLIPEPATTGLAVALGLGGIACVRRFRNRSPSPQRQMR
jgi:hypothetical protein